MTDGNRAAPRVLPSLRSRLVALIAMVAVPVAMLAAIIAAQNYRYAADRALESVRLARAGEVARYGAAVQGLEQMLGALSQAPAVRTPEDPACPAYLAGVVRLYATRYADLAVFGPQGALRCSGGTAPASLSVAGADWFRAARSTGRFAMGRVERGPLSGQPVIIGAWPLEGPGGFAGVVAAGLRVDWLAEPPSPGAASGATATWLLQDGDPAPLPLAGAAAGNLPANPGLMAAPRDETRAVLGTRARDGQPFAYATTSLAPGLDLLVGYSATAEAAKARNVLFTRVAELAVLLLAALVAVAIGAKVALADPVRRLSRAVARWREGKGFDPGPTHDMPTELRDLAHSFAAATASLAAQETELHRALEQQELAMQEIHHRVKNNLQIVASLLNLQASRIRLPEARAEFQAARDRVRALATLHRHLYAQGEMHTINMRSFLTELCGQLFSAMGETEGGRIRLDIQAPELRMLSDQAVPLSLIVTEAVSNSIKYAFPGGRHGSISVRLAADADSVDLRIEDDGIGIPAGRAETETGPRDGIGMQLIRGFARQLGASLTVDQGGGTRYHVLMPLRRDRPASAPEQPEPGRQGAAEPETVARETQH